MGWSDKCRREHSIGPGNTSAIACTARSSFEVWSHANPCITKDAGGPEARKHVAELQQWHCVDRGCIITW